MLALVSIGTGMAYSQGSGSDTGSAAASDEEEVGNGSGSALVAPRDPKARGAWLREKLGAALTGHPTLGKAKVAAYVVEVESGNPLFASNEGAGMNLASNAKLLTSVAALGTLGGGFRWRTAVYADELDEATGTIKGDLYVRGRGDPTLQPADLAPARGRHRGARHASRSRASSSSTRRTSTATPSRRTSASSPRSAPATARRSRASASRRAR